MVAAAPTISAVVSSGCRVDAVYGQDWIALRVPVRSRRQLPAS